MHLYAGMSVDKIITVGEILANTNTFKRCPQGGISFLSFLWTLNYNNYFVFLKK